MIIELAIIKKVFVDKTLFSLKNNNHKVCTLILCLIEYLFHLTSCQSTYN